MAKVHPQKPNSLSSSSYFSSKQETFTIWMKSLVLNGKGCTVFDSSGQILYRVDNYNCKCRDVYLMDFKGEILFTILKKEKFKLFSFWEGHRSTVSMENSPKGLSFQVRKRFWLSRGRGYSACDVGLNRDQSFRYTIETCNTNSLWKIVDTFGRSLAEVKRKQSRCGVLLGDDVLTMVVEPFVDHCLIMGLFVVYSLINCQM
ncbi:LURP1-related protein domain containing protein [Parasponia andersonii]|uniref:LURP1-related protein domain containing protein n=1 Tax=Parasponia andersonii TaxID=3476 RepID=A0A2P5CQ32_PARAD|nr:LURP1-related protein domain containing protein [Parasponia andersonii]